MKTVEFLNTKVHALTMDETLSKVENIIATGKPHQHICVNAAKIVFLQKDKRLRKAVNSSDLISADGVSVVWASKFLGKPLPERVNGTDLMENLVKLSSEKGYRIFFFGAKEDVVLETIEIFKSQYPKLQIAGYRNGYYDKNEEMGIAEQIKESNADILFIAISTPTKELFLDCYKEVMQVPFIMGVGGSFDVIAGKVKRAPQWLRSIGMEWFYRILQEPRRMWRRYATTNPKFVYLILKEKFFSK